MKLALLLLALSLWAAAFASTLVGPPWTVLVIVSGSLFFAAVLVIFWAANRPRRTR